MDLNKIMTYYIIKIIVSALLIVSISEVSKRFSFVGAILASVPLTSVLAMIWMYQESKDTEQVALLSTDIFWLVIPSLSFFIAFPILLRNKMNFYISMAISLAIMIIFYFLMIFILKKMGIRA